MSLERKHKIMIGSFSTLIIIFFVVNSIFLYILFVKLDIQYNSLNKQLDALDADTQSKISQLTSNLVEVQENLGKTQESLSSLNSSIKNEINNLKASTSSDFSGVIEDSIVSVVTIRTDVAQGTGFIITSDGYIVTNAHVLSGARALKVITYDKESHETEFIGYNPTYDIALLKINGNFDKLELSSSDNIQVGEKVIAIGNPLGLQFSVSEGIVSGVDRVGSNGLEVYIQTDAALNPGNSGGPLINKQGQAIGINNFKISSGESLGFALESDYIKEVVNTISQEELGNELL